VIYDVRHVTTYTYEAPVASARCTLRLTPQDGAGQRLISSRIMLKPAAARRSESVSYFGARTVEAIIDTPHRDLRIEAHSRVDVSRTFAEPFAPGQAWETIRESAVAEASLAATAPVQHLFPSRAVPLVADVTDYAAQSFPAGRGVLAAANDLCGRIKRDFVYDPRSTQVSTPLLQAFERRRGVCQDFAHIMIAGLRGLGIPAAYVSGYIHTAPPPGRPKLQGADATHAWVSVWCGGGLGWVGLDPTNAVAAADQHIILCVGRDYADVSPVDGVLSGSGSQKLAVEVDVTAAPDEETGATLLASM
jgi:transglutaminase-like putative cysteine protease